MSAPETSTQWWGRRIEAGFAVLVLVYLYAAIMHVLQFGFLPQPYFADPTDELMDGFNVAYWSNTPGAYDFYRSIYPPLSFVFSQAFSIPSCYEASAFIARDCDWLFMSTLFGFFFLNAFIIYRSYRFADPTTAIARTIALALGLPMTFALQRGNLILPCFAAFALGYGPLLGSGIARRIAVGLSVNFKPYLLVPALADALRGRWRSFEGSVVAIIIVYALTWVWKGEGSPYQIYQNIAAFVDDPERAASGAFTFATSYSTLIRFLNSDIPLLSMLGSRTVEFFSAFLPLVIRFGQVFAVGAFIATFIEPKAVSSRRLAAVTTMFVLVTTDATAYAETFGLYLVFFERWKGPALITALVCAYAACIAVDFVVVPLASWTVEAWISGGPIRTDYAVTARPFVRPLLLIIICCALSIETMADVIRYRRAHRFHPEQGEAMVPAE